MKQIRSWLRALGRASPSLSIAQTHFGGHSPPRSTQLTQLRHKAQLRSPPSLRGFSLHQAPADPGLCWRVTASPAGTLGIPAGSAAGMVPGELSKHRPQDTAVCRPKTSRERSRQPVTPRHRDCSACTTVATAPQRAPVPSDKNRSVLQGWGEPALTKRQLILAFPSCPLWDAVGLA